ncbi:MAG: ATP-binding protein [Candidatus Omnitrophica bacterium]|nr:ATP-binding protein [Candidatus Omnitrophota bacterium]
MFIEPVSGKKFFGREQVLGTLQKRITDLKGGYRQNLALTGPMLAGKSSILRNFLKNIKDPSVIPLYIDMDGVDFNFFCTQFMASILYRYLKSIGKSAGNDFNVLRKSTFEFIPKTVRSMDKITKLLKQKRNNNAAYKDLLKLTSIFKDETGKRCVVILDEFHNMSNFQLRKPFQVFGKFIMVQKNTMYIVSSSQKTLLKEILSEKLSLLFGNFEVLEVEGFDGHTARSFIAEKVKDVDLGEDVRSYIIQVSRGNPFYVESLAGRLAELVKRRKGARQDIKECLLNAFTELLFESNGVLNQYFNNNINFFLEKKARKQFIPILISLAKGNKTIKAIQGDLDKKDKDLSLSLQALQDMDLIDNSGVFYQISDKLFSYWLKYVYDAKGRSLINDMDIKYLEFKKAIEDDFKEYCLFNSKDLVAVVRDLLKSFNGEKVQINMNLRKMPYFDRIETNKLSDNIFQITGSVQNRDWVCYIKQGDIADEQDVSELWEVKSRHKKSKIIRKIFIPLKGIEQNAFLLAKEQNLWIWDTKQINELLRLFGKFEIVL